MNLFILNIQTIDELRVQINDVTLNESWMEFDASYLNESNKSDKACEDVNNLNMNDLNKKSESNLKVRFLLPPYTPTPVKKSTLKSKEVANNQLNAIK